MKNIIAATILALLFTTANSQDTSGKFRKRIFKAEVYDTSGKVFKNYLVQVNDSSVVMSSIAHPYNRLPAELNSLKQFHYREIDLIKLKRKGAVGRGALTGGLIGTGLGLLVILAKDLTEPETNEPGTLNIESEGVALFYGVSFGLGGAIIGGTIGALASKKIIIKGRPSALKELNYTLLERVYSQ